MLPPEVSHLVLLLNHEDALVVPAGFETWRTAGHFENPYSTLLGLGNWTPTSESGRFSRLLQLEIERREQPAAQSLDAARERFALMSFSLGHLTAMYAAASADWRVSLSAIERQIDDVTEHVQQLATHVDEATTNLIDHPEWEPVVSITVDALGACLGTLMSILRGDIAQDALEQPRAQLSQVWAVSGNQLYLNRRPESGSSREIDAAVQRLQAALDAFMVVRQQLVDELLQAAAVPSTISNPKNVT
jgi:hypothetical protein